MTGDEWYVGIAEIPTGPMTLAELRTRALRREVTAVSLVWRDGFEDWKPLSSYPELVAILEECLSSPEASSPDLFPPPTPAPAPVRTTASATATPEPTGAPLGPISVSVAVENPVFAERRAPVYSQAPAELTAAELEAMGVSQRSGPSMGVLLLALFAAVILGAAGALVLPGLLVNKPAVPVAANAPKASVGTRSGDTPPAGNAAVGQPETLKEAPIVAVTGRTNPSGGPLAKTADSSAADAQKAAETSAGLKGLAGLKGVSGPQGGPSGAVQAPTSGEPLDAAAVQRTVARYTPAVRRRCWQPALDTRAQDAPTSARVMISIQVASNGKVSTVSSTGDPRGYRGLARCIESSVRGWEFPPSSGQTPQFNVPFVFAAQ